MPLSIVPGYAALLGLFYIWLSVNVVRGRNRVGVALGSGGDPSLERRIRVHGNMAEYAPFALLLLAMAELRGAPALLLHPLCICLTAGRLVHAWGVSRPVENFRYRVLGMALTLTALGCAAILVLLQGFGRMV